MVKKYSFLMLLLTFSTIPAYAQTTGHEGHHMAAPALAADPYAASMEKMHKDMMVKPTGNVDADFMRGMIPHHQGAVDMAKVVLEKGSDPEVKKFAQEIIAAQEKEIAFMKEWLKKNGY